LQAEKEMNTSKRAALYNQIQKIYMANGPQIYLFHPSNLWATSSKANGFQIYKTALHPFMTTWLPSEDPMPPPPARRARRRRRPDVPARPTSDEWPPTRSSASATRC